MKLFKHQKLAVEWLCRRNSGLVWASTGTGKTLIATVYAERVLERPGASGGVLVICPSSVRYQWQSELKKYYGLESLVIEGKPEERKLLWNRMMKYKIVNYELLLKDYKYALSSSWDLIICDESHRIANARAKTVKIIKKLTCKNRVGLSATPICNGKYDLFSQLDWISPGCLGKSWWEFRSRYCIMHTAFPKIIGYRETERFDRISAPLLHRIGKEVLQDLPPMSESIIPFELSSFERRLYEKVKKEIRLELESGQDIPILNALGKLLRLRQITNTIRPFGYATYPSKLATLIDLLDDVLADPEAKVIIFTSFAETVYDYMQDLHGRWHTEVITGDFSQSARQQKLEDFENGSVRILLGTDALSTGLNLQAANVIVHIDEPWSYSKYDQRNGRAWRQGQKRHVNVYSLIVRGSVDEYVHKIIEAKKNEVNLTLANIKEILL